ncbi:lipase family protein [Nocardia terpenica]|nr:lipase family protein [Nocardia terpenica]
MVGSIVRAVVIAVVLATASMGHALVAPAQAEIPAPQDDPFYSPPAGFEATEPGTVLRSRPVQLQFQAPVQSWQLLYRTTDFKGDPDATVTTVILPADVRPDRPVLSYQPPMDSPTTRCAPSYQLQAGVTPDMLMWTSIPLLTQALQKGWVVAVPDFEGPHGHYVVAKEPGYMSLDGIRAAERFSPLGLAPDTRVGLLGYSGGSLPTVWAAEMQPGYAPELNLVGNAFGGTPAELEPVLLKLNGGPSSGLIAAVLASLSATYPERDDALHKYMAPEGLALIDRAKSLCVMGANMNAQFVDWQRYVSLPIEQLLALPAVKAILDENTLGTPAPTAPLLATEGLLDEIVPVEVSDRMVERLCAAGTPVTYLRDQTADHVGMFAASLMRDFAWLEQRLDGTPAPAGCSTQTVPSVALMPPS